MRGLAPLAILAGLAGAGLPAAVAAAPASPLVLVTESGGFAQAAPDRPLLAIYADGRAVRGGRVGRVDLDDVHAALARYDREGPRPVAALAPCNARDLATAEITIRQPRRPVATLEVYGLGACATDAPVSRLVDELDRLPLSRSRRLNGPWVAQAVLADDAPGRVPAWRGPRLLPGAWVRVPDSSPRLVGDRGHRYALLPRALLPHERARGEGPGDLLASLVTTGGPAPANVSVRGDGGWWARGPDGRWSSGRLDPAERAALRRGLQAAGALSLPARCRSDGVPRTVTLRIGWGRAPRTARADPAAPNPCPPGLRATELALRLLRPTDARPLEPQALRAVYRPLARAGRRAPAIPVRTLRLRGRGTAVVIGTRASALWAALGERSFAGPVRQGRAAFRLGVDPLR